MWQKWKRPEMSRDEEMWCNYGMLRPAPGRHRQAHILRLPRWPWPHTWPTVTQPRPPALHRQQGYGVPWKNTAKCLPNTQLSLRSCCAVEGEIPSASRTSTQFGCTPDLEESPACSPTPRAAAASPAQGLQEQSHTLGTWKTETETCSLWGKRKNTASMCSLCLPGRKKIQQQQTTTNS